MVIEVNWLECGNWRKWRNDDAVAVRGKWVLKIVEHYEGIGRFGVLVKRFSLLWANQFLDLGIGNWDMKNYRTLTPHKAMSTNDSSLPHPTSFKKNIQRSI